MGWPATVNGNTYNLADFDGFAYTVAFPNIINDIGTVGNQVAADRAAIIAALAPNGNLLIPQTQGRLDYISTTQIRLVQAGGSFLWIDGLNRQIPAGSVTLSNAGLLENTLYYIYAYMNGANIALEASTTGHASHASGIRVKSGDSSRTLVGMVYMNTGGVFASSASRRFVRSFYNRPALTLSSAATTATSTSTTSVEVSTGFQVQFLVFADDVLDLQFTGHTINNGGFVTSFLGLDGGNFGVASISSASGGSANYYPTHCRATATVSEGMHIGTLRGSVTAGTGNWIGLITGAIG